VLRPYFVRRTEDGHAVVCRATDATLRTFRFEPEAKRMADHFSALSGWQDPAWCGRREVGGDLYNKPQGRPSALPASWDGVVDGTDNVGAVSDWPLLTCPHPPRSLRQRGGS
jgi:hypothetical protein